MFNAVEINSSFYRPHRPATYARWAASVPDDFRFAVKLPKAITHDARLVGCERAITAFATETASLGGKRGAILVQLPPSLAFDAAVAAAFLDAVRPAVGATPVVCEPRHASWFAGEADALLARHRIARVAADPPPAPGADEPGGWPGLRYVRLHGSPRVYWSRYDMATIARIGDTARASAADSWIVFDNTASGAAIENALELRERLGAEP